MAKNPNQKLKLLYLMQIFTKETDERHGITMAEILDRLEAEEIKAERKSIYDDIALLREFGLDIITRKTNTTEYYVGGRDFEYPELTLLVDAVQSSKFLTEKKSKALIEKLETLTSIHEAKLLNKQVYVAGRVKMQNESIYYNVDAIQHALYKKKKIRFRYYDYDISKDRVARKGGDFYYVSPVGLTYIDEYYYLITYYLKHNDFVNYRVDRMTNIEVLDEPTDRIPASTRFDMAEYCQRKFSMFGGEETRVQLEFDKSLMNPIIDRFGKDVRVERASDSTARVYVAIAKSSVFFGWLTQFGEEIRIVSPDNLAEEYKAFLKKIIKRY